MTPRPELPCCTPTWTAFPSGKTWAHARTCPRSALQKVRPGEDHPSRRRQSVWWSPQPFAGLEREASIWRARFGGTRGA